MLFGLSPKNAAVFLFSRKIKLVLFGPSPKKYSFVLVVKENKANAVWFWSEQRMLDSCSQGR